MGDTSKSTAPRAPQSSPGANQIEDYAQTCVAYVKKSIGVALDFTVETLPLLDHYLRQAREVRAEQPETAALIATVAGCYVGEVLRQRHQLAWDQGEHEPLRWKLHHPAGSLTIFPVALASVALEGPQADPSYEVFALDPKLRDTLKSKLDELPQVDEEEFVAPSTRVEVVDMAIDLLTAWNQEPEK